jgi:hypothetical protein
MALVTVSIPTYNRRAYLSEALASVTAQTFRDFEVLVSDNGSTDGTEELVAEYAQRDRRFRYHRFQSNRGLAGNMRYVINEPTTELVALLPDDDLWLPHHLEAAVRSLQGTRDAVLYGCTTEFFGEKPPFEVHQPYWMEGHTTPQVFDTRRQFAPWLRETPMAPVSVVLRAAARRGLDGHTDDSFGPMDWLYWGQIALQGSTVFDPTVGAKLRWHTSNQSNVLLKGLRANVQRRYVMRRLATLALEQGALTPETLVEEVRRAWPTGSAADLIIALAAYDSVPSLRKAALEIFATAPELGTSPQSTKHCRMASRVGTWYLGCADLIDRTLGRWSRPAPRSNVAAV